jgi:hypothetical protein
VHQTVAAGTEVLAAVGVKTTVFWDEVVCNQEDIHTGCPGGMCQTSGGCSLC